MNAGSIKQHSGSTVRYPRIARMNARCDFGVFSGDMVLPDTPIRSRGLYARLRAILEEVLLYYFVDYIGNFTHQCELSAGGK